MAWDVMFMRMPSHGRARQWSGGCVLRGPISSFRSRARARLIAKHLLASTTFDTGIPWVMRALQFGVGLWRVMPCDNVMLLFLWVRVVMHA
jgi:hypothetical protein